MRSAVLLAAAVIAVGCAHRAATEILVSVDAEGRMKPIESAAAAAPSDLVVALRPLADGGARGVRLVVKGTAAGEAFTGSHSEGIGDGGPATVTTDVLLR